MDTCVKLAKQESRNVRVTWKTSTVLVCKCVSRGRLSQYFLPYLRIYVGGISLVNIGFYQTLKSLITFNKHCIILRYTLH